MKACQDPVSFVEKLQNKVIFYSKIMFLAFEDDLCLFVAYVLIKRHLFNHLTPKSDKHLISPYNITPESYIKVARMKEMISH